MKTVKEVVSETKTKKEEAHIRAMEAEIRRLQTMVERMSSRGKVHHVPVGVKNTFRFAAFGDTQLGNNDARPELLDLFFKECRRQKITQAFMTGDVLDGYGVYPGHEFEVNRVGFEQQLDEFNLIAKMSKGIKVHFITGNHDASFWKKSGVNVGKHIETRAKELGADWNYLYRDFARVAIKTPSKRKCSIALIHPDGGTAYALSYKPQQIVRAMSGGTKPNILLIGHYHKTEHMPNCRGVATFQTGCFCGQTPYMVRKQLEAHMGGWIVDVTLGAPGDFVMKIKGEFISFYEASHQ